MALQKLVFRPGINKENTNYAGEGGWFDCDKIRFRSGFPEKIGGWTRFSKYQYLGTCRSLNQWTTLGGDNLIGVGTNEKFYINQGGAYNDITPFVIIDEPYVNKFDTAFSTLNGGISASDTSIVLTSGTSFPNSGTIKIDSEQMTYTGKSTNTLTGVTRGANGTTAVSHLTGANVGCATIIWSDVDNDSVNGQFIVIDSSAAVGGISAAELSGEFQITKTSAGVAYFTTTGFSTSAATGGNALISYEVPPGLDVYTYGTGWGAGPWSRGGWGSGYTSGIGQQLRLWSQDNFGEDLIYAPRGGAMYYWDATTGVDVRGISLKTAAYNAGYTTDYVFVPNSTYQVISSTVQRFCIAFGANNYDPTDANTPFDPLLVRWSDQENPYDWVPTALNQAGEQRLSIGSQIVTAVNTRQEILVLTDAAIYSMQYLGPPYTFGFQLLQDNISIMGPKSAITINNVTYWMGADKFFMYTGRVETLPCTVRQFIFQNLNKDQSYQVFAASNEQYSEVWWFYCSTNSNTVDSYVVYNYLDRVWYYGTMARTAWLDSGVLPYPIAADYNNRLLNHEAGVDDVSGDSAAAIDSYIQSSDFDIGDGHNFGFVWRILPDLTFAGSSAATPSCTMVIKPRLNAGSSYGTPNAPTVTRTQEYPVEEFTGQVYTRVRGRQMAFRIESADLGTTWQLGSPRMDIRQDGRR